MSRNLVITTKSWKALIESLKANSKHGYNRLESLKHDGVYYTAILCQNTDANYLERLKIVTGHSETGDEEDVEHALYFLCTNLVPFPPKLLERINSVLELAKENKLVDTDPVFSTKLKRTTRSKK
mgnify:CR=1 FL=1